MTEQVKVTQADRDAAQALCASGWTHATEAFARHAIAAQAELLEALENARAVLIEHYAAQENEYPLDKINAAIAKAKGEA